MSELTVLVVVIGLGVTLGLLWAVRRIHQEVNGLKREWYYHQQALKKIPHEIQTAVDPLKIHVAALAEGKAVSSALIRSGRLYQELSMIEAVELLKNPVQRLNIVLLDVRSGAEFAKRRIPGAVLIPVEQLDTRYGSELSSTAQYIMVYCEEGDRSRLACEFLSRQGLPNVYLLRGGLADWPGPVEGNGGGELIQIASKTRSSSNPVVS
ncbi:MAG: rhodanese-like domain-containing protein [Nitrospirales bacterium]|nr:rhodanese-like domain-containing protein [Nitrospirales bacterium]